MFHLYRAGRESSWKLFIVYAIDIMVLHSNMTFRFTYSLYVMLPGSESINQSKSLCILRS